MGFKEIIQNEHAYYSKEMQILYQEDRFYKIYHQTKTDQHGLKKDLRYCKMARLKKCHRPYIISRLLQLLQTICCKIVKKTELFTKIKFKKNKKWRWQ